MGDRQTCIRAHFRRRTKQHLLLAVALLISALPGAEASVNAIKDQGWQNICKVTGYLQKIPGLAKQQIADEGKAATNARIAALALSPYAASSLEGDKRLAIQAVTEKLLADAHSAYTSVLSHCQVAITAAATTAELAGRGIEVVETLAEAISGSTGYCVMAQGNGGQASNFAGLTGCNNANRDHPKHGNKISTTDLTSTGFADLNNQDVKDTSTGNTKCVLFQAAGADNAKLFQEAKTVNMASGMLVVGTTTPTLHLATAQQLNANGRPDRSTLLKAAHADAYAVNTRTPKVTAINPQAAAEQATKDPETKAKLAKILKRQGVVAEDGPAIAEANRIYIDLFGTTGEKMSEIWVTVMQTRVTGSKDKTEETATIESIMTENQLQQVLDYYKHQMATKLKAMEAQLTKAEAACKSAVKPPETICNEIGENKTKCGETEGCHFVDTDEKGKKCTLTKEAAEKAAASQETGKDGEKEDKCSHKKKEGECTGNCKWDGKECKDSSFLLNKHFAISVFLLHLWPCLFKTIFPLFFLLKICYLKFDIF
uniref:Variant surface glycoprotein 1125.521 n=1 Tax=Trypanosoma brucei TaxID=5691 RepID=A0A1J0R4C6_9TRYP|nr:variant surface glycoprotein 1125.521 [Trypanosoma brucei]